MRGQIDVAVQRQRNAKAQSDYRARYVALRRLARDLIEGRVLKITEARARAEDALTTKTEDAR